LESFVKFSRAAKRWFIIEEMAPDRQIGCVIWNFEHPWIAPYVQANESRLRALPSFDDFVRLLRDTFLPHRLGIRTGEETS
jgi:hypothetical protein